MANSAPAYQIACRFDYLYLADIILYIRFINYGICFAGYIHEPDVNSTEEQIMLNVLCILLLSSALILSLWAFWMAVRELMSE
jgi:hypothetical protein